MYAIEAGSLSNWLTKEVDFGYAIEAGSLTEQARRRGRSSNTPLKQAHCRPGSSKRSTLTTPLNQAHCRPGSSKRSTLTTPLKQAHFRTSSLFRHAIEAGSLSTGSLKRSTLNDDAGYLDSTAPRAPSFPYGLGRLAHFRMA